MTEEESAPEDMARKGKDEDGERKKDATATGNSDPGTASNCYGSRYASKRMLND
jgi:hypothetical protein